MFQGDKERRVKLFLLCWPLLKQLKVPRSHEDILGDLSWVPRALIQITKDNILSLILPQKVTGESDAFPRGEKNRPFTNGMLIVGV